MSTSMRGGRRRGWNGCAVCHERGHNSRTHGDELNALFPHLSRQRRWQLRMKARHRCYICGKSSGFRSMCRLHLDMRRKKGLKYADATIVKQ